MNAYIVVEGKSTEPIVYKEWLSYLAPSFQKVENAWEATERCYYLFSGGGIPSIYRHVANAIADINQINKEGKIHYDYLMVCIDEEDSTKEEILESIQRYMDELGVVVGDFEMHVFIQKVCIETWFLGNRRVIKHNPQSNEYIKYLGFYDVQNCDPQLMENYDRKRFSTKAKFHLRYLKTVLEERNMRYSKTHPGEVCREPFLNELIKRYQLTSHISTFGDWYRFVIRHFR